jgi:NADH:ubiquinone oxidoreductase subunit K
MLSRIRNASNALDERLAFLIPFFVTTTQILVLIQTSIFSLRAINAVYFWQPLIELRATPHPIYIVLTGAIGAISGVALLVHLYRNRKTPPKVNTNVVRLWCWLASIIVWTERIFISQVWREDFPLQTLFTVMLLAFAESHSRQKKLTEATP